MQSQAVEICPVCNKLLVMGPDGRPHWCETCWVSYDPETIDKATAWRKMSSEKRIEEIASHGEAVLELYRISKEEYLDAIAFSDRQKGDVLMRGDVAPGKEALLSLARGLSDSGALREMIDNSLDCAQRKRGGAAITVTIELNAAKGFVRVTDDAGGMTESEMLRCLKLGAQAPETDAGNVIGRFGVGAKEAIYHFGREVLIASCDISREHGIETFLPASWLDELDWKVDFRRSIAPKGTTQFTIGVLDNFDFDSVLINSELWETYRKRIKAGRLNVLIDGFPLHGEADPIQLYPPELYPRKYNLWVSDVMVDVEVSILADDPASSGIFFYTFGRRFAHWTWSDPLTRTIVEKPPQSRLNSHFRVEIDFQGKIEDIPINSNKDQVDTGKYVFRPLARMVAKIVQPYLAIVSWLSKDNSMSYLRRFAGRPNAHPAVTTDSPGLDSSIVLGKIYENMPLAKPRVADQAIFLTTIANDRRADIIAPPPSTGPGRPNGERENPQLDIKRPGGTRNPPPPSDTDTSPGLSVPKTILTLNLHEADDARVALLKQQIIQAAHSIGIEQITIS